jgi:hypothetical protein
LILNDFIKDNNLRFICLIDVLCARKAKKFRTILARNSRKSGLKVEDYKTSVWSDI